MVSRVQTLTQFDSSGSMRRQLASPVLRTVISLAAMNFAPPAPPVAVSAPVPASAVMVLKVRAGWTDPAHPAPARQFMFILSGQIEVEARGDVRRFSAGDIVLAEDREGRGHATTSLEDTVIANVRV